MMDQQIASRLGADLFLLHAPSVYDFRERDDMLFAYLSDSVNVTSVCDMYPIGWCRVDQASGLADVHASRSGCQAAAWPGSRFAYRSIMRVHKTLIQKDNDLVVEELRTMREAAIRTAMRASVLFGKQGALAPVSRRRKGVRVQHPPLPAPPQAVRSRSCSPRPTDASSSPAWPPWSRSYADT